MKILNMLFTNYGSFYGEHTFTFADRGVALILGRNLDDPKSKSNGSGKSTVGDALEWCLFGEVPRGDSADSIVNDEARKGCTVTVTVQDDDGKLLVVQRNRDVKGQKDGPRVWLNGEEKTTLDGSKTQEVIDGYLGLDRDVFRAAVLFAQTKEFTFADATDAERKEMLTKVLQLDELDHWASIVDEKLRAKETELHATRGKLAGTLQAFDALQAHAVYAQQSAQSWASDHAQRLYNAQQQAQAAMNEVQQRAASLPPEAQMPGPVNVPKPEALLLVEGHIAEREAALRDAQGHLYAARAEYTRLKELHDALGTSTAGKCSQCGQTFKSPEHLANERKALEGKLAVNIEHGKKCGAAVADIEGVLRGLHASKADLDTKWMLKRDETNAAAHAAKAAVVLRAQAELELNEAKKRAVAAGQAATAIAQEQNPWTAQVTQAQKTLDEAKPQIAQLEASIATMELDVAHLAFWKTGFGAKGLKSYVLDARLEEMSTEANRWVNLLTGGTVWVRFETQKQVGSGSKKKLSETFTVRVFRYNPDGTITERNFRSWSGGEKHRIALGIDFGLARLVAQRARRRYDLLILDEIFQKSLDSSGKEAVAEMLSQLASEKSSILVIDHDQIFQGLFEETIVVEKKNRRSRILEGQ